MGDEPYAALLPWAVFAVVDRTHGGNPMWAGIGALVTTLALLATSSRGGQRRRNVMLLGAVGWFGALVGAVALRPSDTSFIAHDGRAISAAGFALIAFASLAFTPAIAHYTRPHVRSSLWNDPAFHRVNAVLTLIWATTFTGISIAHFIGASMDTPEAFTVCNWVLPIAFASFAAHRSRICWENFNADALAPDPIQDLALDWEPPLHPIDR